MWVNFVATAGILWLTRSVAGVVHTMAGWLFGSEPT